MNAEKEISLITERRLYLSANCTAKWEVVSKKENTLSLFLGKIKIASFHENTTDPNQKKYIVTCRIPTVKRNLGTFDTMHECVKECEAVANFYISQISSEY